MSLPSYDELPAAPGGGRLGWHVFGADDQYGLLNLLTPERVADAARLIKRGKVFALDHPIGHFDPPLAAGRRNAKRTILTEGRFAYDDRYDDYFPQAGSQWDALSHVGLDDGKFYNGATADQIAAGERNTVDQMARHGIAGRAVVLDIPAMFAKSGREYDPGTTVRLSVDDLQAAAKHGGIEHRPGDIVLLYTAFEEWYAGLDAAGRAAAPARRTIPGIEQSEDMARYLWDIHCAAIVSDNYALEAYPPDISADARPFGFMHNILIGSFGMPLGELWHLTDLVADCRETGVYEGMLLSAPVASKGVGSNANAIVIK